jgi:putative hydrolase of the HAD superfamily
VSGAVVDGVTSNPADPSPGIEGVLFDAGGVLVAPDPVALQTAMGERSDGTLVPLATILAGHYLGMQALDEAPEPLTAGERLDWTHYRRAVAVHCGFADDPYRAVERMAEVFSPFLWRFPIDRSILGLWRLHNAGVPIGVVSNASGQIAGVLANIGICQVGPGGGVPVRVVVDSHVVGVAKPDPRIFAPAIEALGVDPSKVAYVGDSRRFDVTSARAAGLQPFLLDPYGLRADARSDGVNVITAVSDLLPLLA